MTASPSARLILTVLCAVAGIAIGLPAQEVADYKVFRRPAFGTYQGSRKGSIIDTTYGGDIVTEETRCSLWMDFGPNGSMQFEAGEYFYRKTYRKKTLEGFVISTTEIRSPEARGTRSSRLSLWVAEDGKVRNAEWNPRVQVPGTVTTQTTWTDVYGRVRRRSIPVEQPHLVFCDVYVLWRGSTNDGPGLPFASSVTAQADSSAKTPWIKIDARWKLRTSP